MSEPQNVPPADAGAGKPQPGAAEPEKPEKDPVAELKEKIKEEERQRKEVTKERDRLKVLKVITLVVIPVLGALSAAALTHDFLEESTPSPSRPAAQGPAAEQHEKASPNTDTEWKKLNKRIHSIGEEEITPETLP